MSGRLAATAASYRVRLVVGFTLVIGVLAGAWAWSLYAPLTTAVMGQQEERLLQVATSAAALLDRSDLPPAEVLGALSGDGAIRITLVSPDGTVLADTEEDVALLDNHGDRPEIRDALAGETGIDVRTSETQGLERMYVAVPARMAAGTVAVRTSQSLEQIAGITSRARRAGLVLLPVALLIAAAAAWGVTRAAAGPVERLAQAARAMADGDLGAPVPDDLTTLRPLSEALAELRIQLRARLNALESEERTLRVALNGLSDAVLLLDGDRVRLANRALGTMFRTPPGSLSDRTLAELGLPAPVESSIAMRIGAAAAATADLGPDPFQRYHRVLVVPLGEGRSADRTLVVITDTTDRMRLDAVRRDFVANASHELKTPVSGILLLAEAGTSASRDGDTDQALAFLGQIHGEASRLRTLVAELLDLSRIESVPHVSEVADVRHAIELALAGHRRAAAAKGLALGSNLELVTGEDVAVACGSTDVAIVLDNVLSNAISYTEAGQVTVALAADDAAVTVTVSDTGIGIPASEVERVFERFYRVDRARSRTSGGTGLGLALVRNIVERAGGTVSIISEPDVGTTVCVKLRRVR